MKKMFFSVVAIIVISGLGSSWNWCIILPLVLIGIYILYLYPQTTLPPERDYKKEKEILKNFEKEISGKKGDDNSICDLLKRQTVQDLYYLRAGLKDRIFSCRAGGMTTMSIREEEYLDMEIKYYERLLTLTNRYIPEEDER
ncbi:MAG: hypothetical protein OSJ76_08270 [Alphaproteobacteria bacterium]|nr:hypothetical protein [Alphaproteobacteria bacterium]